MLQGDMKNWAREGILKKSIQILRTHGTSEENVLRQIGLGEYHAHPTDEKMTKASATCYHKMQPITSHSSLWEKGRLPML